jgi:hypothetical protein
VVRGVVVPAVRPVLTERAGHRAAEGVFRSRHEAGVLTSVRRRPLVRLFHSFRLSSRSRFICSNS